MNEALDLIEYEGMPVVQALAKALAPRDDRPAAHHGLAAWTAAAIERYQQAGTEGLTPVAYKWVRVTPLSAPDQRGAARYEECVWGRPYASPDGSVRELWIPVAGPLSAEDRSEAEMAAAAMAVAFGQPHQLPDRFRWKKDATQVETGYPADTREPAAVRIREVSCLTGERRIVSEGNPAQIKQEYERTGKGRLADVVTSGGFAPGFDCEDCKLVPVCPALRRGPGLLGIEDRTQPRRVWSVTNGRSYVGRPGRSEECPAREHLRRLRLPDRVGRSLSPAVVRGHAVHTWIQDQHERTPGVACRPEDAPDGSAPWSAGKWLVPEQEASMGARMVAAHTRHCPYRLATVTGLVHERSIVRHDAAADIIVIAKADMVYRDGASWVYRELKTDARSNAPAETDLLRSRPQLALAVRLLQSSGIDPALTRVELEVLGPDGARLTIVDPADPDTQARARAVVHELAADWHGDTTAVARPGRHCQYCEMTEWCRPDLPSAPEKPEGRS
ncbi:PD-(D/E)XK nuclease family protein [Streptomyces microflavus]|uniref:PD-(D/E)XK nuclease family protein n=1 Tax=Streptomyces microflavus TaxID=1919 RepID=UPI0033B1DE5E